jgi:hypothetical protein
MTTSKKKRKCLLACARRGMTLGDVNTRLREECLDPIHSQCWNLWVNYYADIVRNDSVLEHELITNNRSLAWFAAEMNRRKRKIMLS